jgi:hypothetical protein
MFENSIITSIELPGLIPWGGIAISFIDSFKANVEYNSWRANGTYSINSTMISLVPEEEDQSK